MNKVNKQSFKRNEMWKTEIFKIKLEMKSEIKRFTKKATNTKGRQRKSTSLKRKTKAKEEGTHWEVLFMKNLFMKNSWKSANRIMDDYTLYVGPSPPMDQQQDVF